MRRPSPAGPKGPATDVVSGPGGAALQTGPARAAGRGRSRRRYDPAWDDWKPARRWPGVLASCTVVLIFLAALIWYNRPVTPSHSAGIKGGFDFLVKQAYVPVLPASGGGSVTRFSGKSSADPLVFNATGDLAILHAACECVGNFVVVVSNPQGEQLAYPVNAIDLFDAVMQVSVPRGHDRLKVIATGPWTVQVIQPSAGAKPIPTPFKYFSDEADVVGPFSAADHFLSFKFVPFPNGNVSVFAVGLQGNDLLPFDRPLLSWSTLQATTQTLHGLTNPYYLEIDSSGSWNLKVQRSAAG